jgi:DNA (cytosine-5)-methyltransferase 1
MAPNLELGSRPIAIDLFAGAGGMTLGFEQAGFDVLAAVEIDPIHCAIHEFNFPQWTTICKSVNDVSAAEIRSKSKIGDRSIDVVFGGSPCQGFSLIGKRALDDPRNALIAQFVRLVVELQPNYFVLENVKGLTFGKHRQFLSEVIEEFEQNGYKVQKDYRVLNACHYGVPQNRERLFLLGCKSELALPEYPKPISQSPKPHKKLPELAHLPNAPTVQEAIADLPTIENYPQLIDQDYCEAEFQNYESAYSKAMKGLNFPDDYSYHRNFNAQILTCSKWTHHAPESVTRFGLVEPGKTDPISHFLKLDPNGICNTLRAGTPRNRGAFTSPRPIHPHLPRCITVREAARLHSFPDWFRFHQTKWHGLRQIGNSVPPLLAKAIATAVMKALARQPIKPEFTLDLPQEDCLRWHMSQAATHFQVDARVIEPRKKVIEVLNNIDIDIDLVVMAAPCVTHQ